MNAGQRARGKEKPLSSSAARGSVPADAKLLARALVELSATRKTLLMYPAGHTQIQQSIERAQKTWDEILMERPEMTVGTDTDGLIVGRNSTKLKDPVSREFSSILREHDVAVVHFRQGLTAEELTAFLRVIADDPDKTRAAGGIDEALVKKDVRHIRVQQIDYTKFLHTEEEEIRKRPRGKGPDGEDSLWGGFVTHLILGTLTDSEKGIPLRSADEYAPRVIAAYLNENRLDPQMALEGYEQTLQQHLAQAPDEGDNKKYRVANLRNLSALLEELQPGIRQQFLDATYQKCAGKADNEKVQDLLSGLSHGLIIEMLRHANKQGNEISPTLLNLVQKIARIKEESSFGTQAVASTDGTVSSDPIRQKEILDLFDREAYENYVTAEYGETLKKLSLDGAVPSDSATVPKELEEEVKRLESRHVDAHIARALLAFMEGDAAEEEYRDYGDKAFQLANELMGDGEFSVPLEILTTLDRHAGQKPAPQIRSLAEAHARRFRSPAFLAKALAAFDKWRASELMAGQAFLAAIGPEIVPHAFNLYIHRNQAESDEHLLNLLAIFSDRVTDIARREIQTRGGPPLVRMIRLVRRLGNKDLIPELRPLLDRDDRQVRMETLETLVRFRDPESADLLRKFLRLKNAEDQLRVIEIAGMHRVADLAQEMVSMIRPFSLFPSDYVKNEKLVEALGRIGHPGALPGLRRLAKTRLSLYPKRLANLKLLLFQSLRLYEDAPVAPLLRLGAQSRDGRIRTLCRERLQGPGPGRGDPAPASAEA
jgi:hypothetical protein